eukprot:1176823-Alexandrium_andersonii.AAC.1
MKLTKAQTKHGPRAIATGNHFQHLRGRKWSLPDVVYQRWETVGNGWKGQETAGNGGKLWETVGN